MVVLFKASISENSKGSSGSGRGEEQNAKKVLLHGQVTIISVAPVLCRRGRNSSML